jgi:hypothetical protein
MLTVPRYFLVSARLGEDGQPKLTCGSIINLLKPFGTIIAPELRAQYARRPVVGHLWTVSMGPL